MNGQSHHGRTAPGMLGVWYTQGGVPGYIYRVVHTHHGVPGYMPG